MIFFYKKKKKTQFPSRLRLVFGLVGVCSTEHHQPALSQKSQVSYSLTRQQRLLPSIDNYPFCTIGFCLSTWELPPFPLRLVASEP